MSLTEVGYKSRIADALVAEALQVFGAVSIEGPKFCGKTWTALNHANSVVYIADPIGGFANRQRAQLDPSLILDGDAPRLVDEWQDVPGIWDAVRFAVDRSHEKGRFLLAGSTMPPKKGRLHSGAGRIESVRMWTMTSSELNESKENVSLTALMRGNTPSPINSDATIDRIIEQVVRGGWPEGQDLPLNLAMRIPQNYLQRLITEDMTSLDDVSRDPSKVRATLQSLARNNATLVRTSTILQDIDAHRESISRDTVNEYLSAFKRLYVLDELPAWAPSAVSRKRMRQTPKRLLTDQSLAVAALGLTPERLKNDLFTLGFMFEAMCLKDLAVYCAAAGANLYHLDDGAGLDADAILEMPDGSWTAVEIKLGHHQVDDAAAKLLRIKDKFEKAGVQTPTCLLVIVGLSGFAHRREDGVVEVPLDCLGV
ncbi:MAG: DUF4143 domain-containing protein [Clostridiales Family XIII bacterium]|jgi:predicted AAA+ superfamily ATPase|nr:DUF4143 domain-containing protein [Clostridiales Family XIII bacterium]